MAARFAVNFLSAGINGIEKIIKNKYFVIHV